MNTFLSFLFSGTLFLLSAFSLSAQSPARAYYLAADVCGNEAQSQYFLLYAESDYKFGVMPPQVSSFCPTGGPVKTITAYSSNIAAVNTLNTKTGGCSDPVFFDLLAAGGSVPAGAVVMVFVSSNPDLGIINNNAFAELCGVKRVYVAFGNYTGTEPFFFNNHPYNATCGNYSIVEIGIGGDKQIIQYDPKRLAPQDGGYVALDGRDNLVRYGQAANCSCPGLFCPVDPGAGITGQLTTCEGGYTTLTAVTQTPGSYTWNWSNGSSGATIQVSPEVSTPYSVTITDLNAPQCAFTVKRTVEVFHFPAITLETMSDDGGPACYGEKTYLRWGVVEPVQVPLTYQWMAPSPSVSIATDESIVLNEQTAGLYTLAIQYANGCTRNEHLEVTFPAQIPIKVCTNAPVCLGETVTLNAVTNGEAFNWRGPGDFHASGAELTLNTAQPGTYQVAVTDENGCTSTGSVAVAFNVCQGGVLSAVASASSATCSGANASATVMASGGTAPYSFNWSHTPATEDPASWSNLSPGSYAITVTDATGATQTTTVTIQAGTPLSGTFTPTNTTCNTQNGSISVNLSNATAPFTWQWSDAGPNSATRTNLAPGTYAVTATDANGCTFTASGSVGASTGISAATAMTTAAACFGSATGAINVTPSGGTTPYTYNWADLTTGPEPEDRTGLIAGVYTLTVTDAQGCSKTGTYNVAQPAALTAAANSTNAICGSSNGTITLVLTGGTSPYTYDWQDLTTPPEPKDRTGLAAGTYTVTITDANNCTQVSGAVITQPATPNLTATTSNTSCTANTGSISVTTTGGITPYTYNWQDITSGTEPEDRTGLAAGTYTVTVTGGNGCTQVRSWTIAAGSSPNIAGSSTNTTCGLSNGTVTVQVSGGSAPYSYDWSHIAGSSNPSNLSNLSAGTYTLTVTSGNGCTAVRIFTIGSSSNDAVSFTSSVTQTTCARNNGTISITPSGSLPPYYFDWSHLPGTNDPQNISNLAAGTYQVTVTSSVSWCSSSALISVLPSTGVQITANALNPSCNLNNGSVSLSVTGVTGPYTYDWSHIAGTNNPQNISSLSPATYTVTVTATTSGCTATVANTLVQKGVPVITPETLPSNCNSNTGSITLFVNGGTTPYNYDWQHISGTNNPANLSGLGTNTYTVTVTDINGCARTSTALVRPHIISISGTVAGSSGGNNGSVTLFVSGNGAPFSYNWSHLPGSNDPQNVTGLSAGTYTVTVTGTTGCTGTKSFTVSASGLWNPGSDESTALKSCRDDEQSVAATTEATTGQLKVFPNPATSLFTLSIPEDYGVCHIAIYDAMSRLVQELTGSGNVEIRPEGWPTGVYSIRVVRKEDKEGVGLMVNVVIK